MANETKKEIIENEKQSDHNSRSTSRSSSRTQDRIKKIAVSHAETPKKDVQGKLTQEDAELRTDDDKERPKDKFKGKLNNDQSREDTPKDIDKTIIHDQTASSIDASTNKKIGRVNGKAMKRKIDDDDEEIKVVDVKLNQAKRQEFRDNHQQKGPLKPMKKIPEEEVVTLSSDDDELDEEFDNVKEALNAEKNIQPGTTQAFGILFSKLKKRLERNKPKKKIKSNIKNELKYENDSNNDHDNKIFVHDNLKVEQNSEESSNDPLSENAHSNSQEKNQNIKEELYENSNFENDHTNDNSFENNTDTLEGVKSENFTDEYEYSENSEQNYDENYEATIQNDQEDSVEKSETTGSENYTEDQHDYLQDSNQEEILTYSDLQNNGKSLSSFSKK